MRKWLSEIRLKQNMTQSEVAKLAKITDAYYYMIENGDRRPSVATAKSIAKVLCFNWTIFFDEELNEVLS